MIYKYIKRINRFTFGINCQAPRSTYNNNNNLT